MRTALVTAFASMLLSAALVPAMAGATVSPVATPAASSSGTQLQASSCKGITDKKCISDTIKRWKRDLDAFQQSIEAKRQAWLDAHPSDGSTDWLVAQKAYSDELRKEVKDYNSQLTAIQKQFYSELKKAQPTQDSRATATGAPNLLPGQELCNPKDVPGAYRICMRQAMIKFMLNLKKEPTTGSGSQN